MDRKTERKIILLLSAVQFVNILDFMIVMPLGPDFAKSLGIPVSQVGVVGASYTAAAAASGFAACFFIDRFDRKKAMLVAMIGLTIGTVSAAFAVNLATLVAARILAGIFGGPAASLSLAMVSDIIPEQRRGAAFAALMGAFSVASVLGVPFGLELARLGNWHTPFLALGAMCVVTTLLISRWLPNFTAHLARIHSGAKFSFTKLILRREVWQTYVLVASSMIAAFAIIPNIPGYLLVNLGFPREHLGFLYMMGGTVSFFVMRLGGWLVDRYSTIVTAYIGTAFFIGTLFFGFINYFSVVPVWLIFVMFMVAMSMRNIAYQSFASKVPRAEERAGFMSLQSMVSHLACAIGSYFSSRLLFIDYQEKLAGIEELALMSCVLALVLPVGMAYATQSLRLARLENLTEPSLTEVTSEGK